MPKLSSLIAHKSKQDLDKLFCRLSMVVFHLSDFGSRKRHGEELLGMLVCVRPEDMTVWSGKPIDFGDVRRPVVGCIER